MSARVGLIVALALGVGCAIGSGCATTKAAARRDPMQCERDPDCARYRGTYADCAQQCADAPDCMDRCREAQSDRGLGH